MNKRSWLALLLGAVITITSFQSCDSDDDDTTNTGDTGPTEWFWSSEFPEDPRSGAASFIIDDKAYTVGGLLKSRTVKNDVFAFDGSVWQEKAEFTGSARHEAVGFAIGNKGFVGTGFDGTDALNDFYSYDASSNAWTKIADFPGEPRFGAVAFSLGGSGYVGLGETKDGKWLGDFYKYNPSNNTWTVAAIAPIKRSNAFAFVIGEKAYVGGGTSNEQLGAQFYSFDGTKWSEPLNSLNRSDDNYTYDVRRTSPATFTIGNYGYIVGGRSLSGVIGNVWKYDPATDVWTNEHQSLLGTAREKAIGFSIDGKGYVATGVSGTSYFDDTWSFIPVR